MASTPLDFGRYHVVQTNILPTSAMLPRLRDGQERFDHISGPFCVRRMAPLLWAQAIECTIDIVNRSAASSM